MDTEVNYLKIGNKVYGIKEIAAEGLDINAELKEFYEKRHEGLVQTFGNVLNENMQEEWNTQIAHLKKYAARGDIKVPPEMYNRPLIVFINMLMEAKIIIYSPNEVATTIAWLRDRTQVDTSSERFTGIGEAEDIIVSIQCPFITPLLLAVDPKLTRIYTPLQRTYHTLSGGYLCTGNHAAKDFWKLDYDGLTREMNRINTFSPATSGITVGGENYTLSNIITNDTITGVEKRGRNTWRT